MTRIRSQHISRGDVTADLSRKSSRSRALAADLTLWRHLFPAIHPMLQRNQRRYHVKNMVSGATVGFSRITLHYGIKEVCCILARLTFRRSGFKACVQEWCKLCKQKNGRYLPIPVAARSRRLSVWLLACWDCGFEYRRGHGCLSLVRVVCCQVVIPTMGRSLVQRSPTEYEVSECDQGAS
jgi:hypothetical protein